MIFRKIENVLHVYLYDDIAYYADSAEGLMQGIVNAGDFSSFILHVNSDGGSITEGIAIASVINSLKVRNSAIIEGIAASMATYVALSCNKVSMVKDALFMIHNPLSIVVGESADMIHQADVMDKMKNIIIDTYENKSGKSRTEISDLMDSESWFNSQEALDNSFIDEIIDETVNLEPVNLLARNYKKIPDLYVNKIKNYKPKKEVTAKMITVESLKKDNPDVYASIAEESAKAERERIQSVEQQMFIGHEDLINQLKFDGKTTGEMAAVAVLKAEKEILNKKQEEIDKQSAPPVPASTPPVNEGNTEGSDDNKELDPSEIWKNNKAVRDEFQNNEKSFLAYCKADSEGLVKIMGGK